MYTLQKTEVSEIEELIQRYYKTLTAPMDDYWEEGIIPSCDFFTINTPKTVGYLALDEDGTLLQFYVLDTENYESTFKELIEKEEIQKAYAATSDELFYSTCKKYSSAINENTYLYTEDRHIITPLPFDDIIMRSAQMTDLNYILEYNDENVASVAPWLIYYYTKLILKNGLYLFIVKGELIGTGEKRKSISNETIMNIGMTVSKKRRQKGVATYIINTMRVLSNNEGYKTICSTTFENIGSQKTLLKCGYRLYHKIDTMRF